MFYLLSSQNPAYINKFESIPLWYFWTQFFAADKYIYDLPKASIGLANRGEGYCESDLNRLDSVILSQ